MKDSVTCSPKYSLQADRLSFHFFQIKVNEPAIFNEYEKKCPQNIQVIFLNME